jgi:hypothetical protein
MTDQIDKAQVYVRSQARLREDAYNAGWDSVPKDPDVEPYMHSQSFFYYAVTYDHKTDTEDAWGWNRLYEIGVADAIRRIEEHERSKQPRTRRRKEAA